jgi:hypothetical protein
MICSHVHIPQDFSTQFNLPYIVYQDVGESAFQLYIIVLRNVGRITVSEMGSLID